ncbi:hypothetical protein IAG41_06195 [Sphingomonas sp. JC676]|uniref:hypothetical protein n=1 Tax=Sphingomonas sp. JC676 TaxID=2768065 RepID=UPI0016576E52|nr:hypothetical protein [Sphingomonas sp. JC676]MBC9031976.1 hypothetical protein [Sphingomonas sp. JC676]
MKPIILILGALLYPSCALAQEGSKDAIVIPEANSSMLVKMNTSISTTTSKVGDPITGEIIDPRQLRGAVVEGTVDRADHAILSFSFHTVRTGGKTYSIQSKLVSITSSKGNEGRDDLDQRVRIEGAGIIAFGTKTALNEGAEVRVSAWKK